MNARPAQKAARPAPRTGDTRDDILRVAGHLLQTRGFSGFSYAHVAEELGVKPPAIHYHFASKTDLGTALIERYHARYRRWIDEAADQGLAPEVQLDGYIRIAGRWASEGAGADEVKRVCPAGALEAELGALPPEMRTALARMADEIHAWLTRLLDSGRRQGAFSFEGSPADTALFIGSAIQGGLQVGRVLGRARFDAVVRMVRRHVGLKD